MTATLDLDKRFPGWTDGTKYLAVVTDYEHSSEFEEGADAVGSMADIASWLRCFPHNKPATIYVANTIMMVEYWCTEFPHLDIKHARSESI